MGRVCVWGMGGLERPDPRPDLSRSLSYPNKGELKRHALAKISEEHPNDRFYV
jgi:hypothetical protein